jgi:hypothetical protein
MPEKRETEEQEVRFKQIAVAGMAGHGAALYGLTEEGRVYLWREDEELWFPFMMKTPKTRGGKVQGESIGRSHET